MNLHILDETAPLKKVVLGIGISFGGIPELENIYDPKTKEFVEKNEFPTENDIISELKEFCNVLEKYNVEVFRPKVIENYNQIFSRDITFVINDKLIKSNVIKNRAKEIDALTHVYDNVDNKQILIPPANVRIEGGDVIVWREHIFVGYSKEKDFHKYKVARTNEAGVKFLKESFPRKTVVAFELKKSDDHAKENALHLDCCFQPVGLDKAIIYKGGFKNISDYNFIVSYFGRDNIFDITKEEMYCMYSNIFSISPKIVVSEKSFKRLNKHLREKWDIIVEEINYSQISKMEGLLRCSTMPLEREAK